MPDVSFDLTLTPPLRTLHLVEEMQARDVQPEIQEVVELLEYDPITTTHLLRQVNSPIYSLRQSVATVDRAATMLGFDSVANTVYVETYSTKPAEMESELARLARGYLIKTAVAAAFVGSELAHTFEMERPAIIRTAALVHQLGRMALLSMAPETYLPLWKESKTPSGQAIALPPGIGREIVHFRTDNARHGQELASTWSLPSDLVESVRHHADPNRSQSADRFVTLAVTVCHYAARSLYEPQEELERDQGGERSEEALAALARAFDVTRPQLDKVLTDAKRTSFKKADAIEL